MWTDDDDERAAADCAVQMMAAAQRQEKIEKMTNTANQLAYVMCGHKDCSFFVGDNPAYNDDPEHLAPYDHFDDGEHEYDHDAETSYKIHTLAEWRTLRPELFMKYADGRIGPNSALFPSTNVTLHFPGFPPIKGVGPVITTREE